MQRAFVRSLLPVVLVAASGLSTGPAEAASATSVTFEGVVTSTAPLRLTSSVHTQVTFTTTLCLEGAANVGKAKPVATAGNCSITTTGNYTGNCALGLAATAGTYTDSAGQTYQIYLNLMVNGVTWTPSANFLKPPTQFGTGFGEGAWLPDLAQCAGAGVTKVPVAAEFAYELTETLP
jgi:hypothetical protein